MSTKLYSGVNIDQDQKRARIKARYATATEIKESQQEFVTGLLVKYNTDEKKQKHIQELNEQIKELQYEDSVHAPGRIENRKYEIKCLQTNNSDSTEGT